MNRFELRQSQRRVKQAIRKADRAFAATLEAVGVQSFFEDAFTQLYGKPSGVTYKAGWFHLQGKRLSRAQLEQHARILYAKIHEEIINA